jgi:predicted nucleic acid-binding protein
MAWLIDTNVLSELRRRKPEPKVMQWFADHQTEPMFLSVISLGESFLTRRTGSGKMENESYGG